MKDLPSVSNPLGSREISQPVGGALVATESERAIQEVQASMVIAKRFPRDEIAASDKIINACTRPTLAAGALYSYPRGGQEVSGPSIRLAEMLAQYWGNLQYGIRELSAENGVSTVEAFCWDVETNTRQVKIFQVPHIRHTNQGVKRLTDPRDIYETVANQGARRLRACILGVIPGDVIEAAVDQCDATAKANVEVTDDTIRKMVESFERWGVTQELIEKRIGKHISSMNPGQMVQLRKIYKSIQDGISKPSAWFDLDDPDVGSGPETSNLDLSKDKTPKIKAPAKKKKPARKKAAAKSDPYPDPPRDATTFAEIAAGIHDATDDPSLDKAEALLDMFLEVGDNGQFAEELRKIVRDKRAALKG